jgi:hypothetical protein
MAFSVIDITENNDSTLAQLSAKGIAPWDPILESVQLDIEALHHFSIPGATDSLALMKFEAGYLNDGFPAADSAGGSAPKNKGEVFLETIHAPRLNFKGHLAGGIATPTSDISGVSRKLGLVPGPISTPSIPSPALANTSANTFSPAVSFKLDESKLLGVIGLDKVLAPVLDIAQQIQQVPKLITHEVQELAAEFEQVKETVRNLQQAIAQLGSVAKTDVDNLVNNAKVQELRALFQLSEIFLRVLIAGDVTLIPPIPDGSLPARLKGQISSLRNQLQNQQAMAQKLTVAQLLAQDNCSDAVTFAQARDCVIALAIQKAVATAAYQQLVTYQDAAVSTIFPVTTQFASFVNSLSTSPWFNFVESLSALEKQLVSEPNVVTLVPALGEVMSAASRVPELHQSTSDLQAAIGRTKSDIAKARQDITAGINNSLTAVKNEQSRLQATLLAVQAQALAISHKQLDISAAVKSVNEITTQANTYLSQLRDSAAAWQQQWNEAWQQAEEFTDSAVRAAAEIQALIKSVQEFANALSHLPKEITTSYESHPNLQDTAVFLASNHGAAADMTLKTTVTAYFDDKRPPNANVSAEITQFTIRLLPGADFLQVGFNSLSFVSTNGSKPSVKALVSDVRFLGPLNFIEKLKDVIKFPGDNGPTIQVTSSGVFVGLRLVFPSIESGAFTLKNIAFESGVTLSFAGDAALVRFSFADSNNRCLLAYGPFGGSGFVALECGLDKIRRLQGALEFGAVLDLNFAGVAHGSAHAFGGIYFDSAETASTIRGYLRVGGELDILGLVSMSVEFFLGLAYENRSGQAWLVGDCSFTVEVDVLFFSARVDLHMHREFSGQSSGGASTSQLYNLDPSEEFMVARPRISEERCQLVEC